MENNFFSNSGSVFIVAELSANHNGNLGVAIETIKAAKRAGADAIKLQTYTADSMTIKSNKSDFIINNGSIWDGNTLYDLYKKASTPWEWHEQLFNFAKEQGLTCFSTPFDKDAVDLLEKIKNPIYKIASFEIRDIELIRYAALKMKPIILSSGIASKKDIELAIKTCRETGNDQIALLKCTSSYPAPLDESNLLMIKEFKEKYNVIPGLSDHTLGITAPIAATCLGAKIIEKHFILDKKIGGPDSSFSLDENEFKKMVKSVREAESSIGKIDYELTEKQISSKVFSRSLYVVENVKKGEFFTQKNIRTIRPGFGIHPKYLFKIIGKKSTRDINKGSRLKHFHYE